MRVIERCRLKDKEAERQRVRQGPPVYMACSVTVTEGVKKGTYGGCQCRSARQTDRRPQRAPGAQY